MADMVGIVGGWKDIQDNPRALKNAKRLIHGCASYDQKAGQMVKYLAEFVGLSCAPDMLSMRIFPNGKEISESFGAYDAVRYRLPQFALKDPHVEVVCVGDGRTPRTGATFALRSAWKVHSVGPMMGGGTRKWSQIRRLSTHAMKIEHFHLKADRVIVVAVHSHANLQRSIEAIEANELAVVAIPCCVKMHLATPPDLEYEEKGIISPCRLVKIWRNVNAS